MSENTGWMMDVGDLFPGPVEIRVEILASFIR